MMGTPFGVAFACLFMSHQEEMIQIWCDIAVLQVLVDDIFGISNMMKDDLDRYTSFVNSHQSSIKYTSTAWTVAPEVSMLDIILSIQGNGTKSDLYCKPTDIHTYLDYHNYAGQSREAQSV